MNVDCAACNAPIRVSSDQVGRLVRCPTCQVVMEVHAAGTVTASMVRCPGCASKLILPDSADAKAFKCPKCSQFLASPSSASSLADASSAADLWSSVGLGLADAPSAQPGSSTATSLPMPGAVGFPRSAATPRPSSTKWKSKTEYSEQIQSVAPGVILLIFAIIAMAIDAIQFFYAMGINDPKLLEEERIRILKIALMVGSSLGGLYMMLIALGAVQMIIRQRIWAGRAACILTILPITVLAHGNVCFGLVAYPFEAAVAVWGLVVLFGRPKPTTRRPI